jgi:two-component system cell cycle sensor histidine kinase/response regulator CckA
VSGSKAAQDLRRQAEETFRQQLAKEPRLPAPLSAEEIQTALHELRVHQIELEMQNEELRRTQVELDRARVEYFNLYDLAPVGYCTISEGLLLKANLTAAGLLGVARKALVGKRMSSFIQKEDQNIYYRHYKQLVKTGAPQVFELRLKKSDGAIFWAQLVATAALDADGLPVCRMTMSDISAIKEAERKLRESQQDFKNLVNSGMALIWTSGTDMLCNYFNSVWLEFTGRSLEEELGNGWAEGVHPDDFQRCLDIYVGAFDRQEPFSMEYRLRHHGGTYRWIIDVGCPRSDSRGEFLGYIGHCLDIDERKRVEEELRDSTAIITSVIENIPLMIFLKESTDLRFVLFNRAGEELLGYDRKTLLGKNNLDLFPPEQAAHFMAKDREVLDGPTGILDIPEEAISTAKKGLRLLHTRKVCIKNTEGTSKFLLGISEDITERKYLEEEQEKLQAQLQQAHKMESVGLLAGGVAHDFNNMLAIILGYTEMILGKVAPTEPLVADLQEIQKAAEHSADLTRQLLAFARKQVVMPRVIDINDTIEGMLRMLRRLIGENIDLVWQPATGLWPVKIDPSQIDQILANLCVNARDAIGGIGRLTIETANRHLDAAYCALHLGAEPGEYVLVKVTDNGCGMDQETLSRIFEPFFTTKTFGEGTGLGLATVYGAVKQNNGFIHVDSWPGSGTTFSIYLPRHTSMAVSVVQEVAAQPTEGGLETILLVEDEAAILKMTTRMLQSLGYTVLAANSPEAAIRLAGESAGTIDLLLTDVVMPEMNGRDLAEHLSAFMPRLKCLLMSGYTADIIARQGKHEPGVYFIEKPFSKDGLAAKVRSALAGNEGTSGDQG